MHLCLDYIKEGVRQLLEDSIKPIERHSAFEVLLNRYCNEIELFNPVYGLVSVKDKTELIIKHILDSLTPVSIIKQLASASFSPRIADVGSGAGLPGIPLALALPDVSFTLIERMGRRAGFLRNTAAILPLPNVEVLETEMEQAPPEIADIVCFRAFHPLEPKILKDLFRLLKPDSYLAAYKGRRETICAEMAPLLAILKQQNAEWNIIPCRVPFLDDERNLILIHKL